MVSGSARPLAMCFAQAAVIVAVGSALGVLWNALHPMSLPLVLTDIPRPGVPRWVWRSVRVIEPKAAHRLWQEREALFLDVRDQADYKQGHVPDAISLPYHEFASAYAQVSGRLPKSAPIVVYCYGSECGLSIRVAKRLLPLGYRDLTMLTGGIAGWQQARYPVTSPKGVVAAPPQRADR